MKTLKSKLDDKLISGPSSKITSSSWREEKKSSSARGYGYKWKKYREKFLFINPLCVFCRDQNRVTAATVVDHIVPHNGDQTLFWDEKNHQPLCKHCHDSVKQKQEKSTY